MQVLRAAASDSERMFPFGVAIQLFEQPWTVADVSRRRELSEGAAAPATALLEGRLSEQLPAAGDHGYPLIRGLYGLARKLSVASADQPSARPLAILVDDLHWSDRPSLRFLAYLAARVDDLPVMLIATVRRGEQLADPAAFSALRGGSASTLIRLKSLSSDGVEQLVRASFQDATQAFVAACWAATRGNPFLLCELLAHLRADRQLPTTSTALRLTELVPESVVHCIAARLGTMSPASRALACAVAVLGDRARLFDAARLAELDDETAFDAADALAAVQLLDANGETLSFIHPLVRSAVLVSLSPLARANAHRRAATVLRAQGAAARAVATHVLCAPVDSDPHAVETLRVAARETLATGEADSAVEMLERALAEQPEGGVHPEVLAELGTAEALAGKPQASERLKTAIGLTREPERRAELALARGQALYRHGAYSDAALAFRAGLHELENANPVLGDQLETAYMIAATLVPELVGDALVRRERMLRRSENNLSREHRAAIAATVLHDSLGGEPRARVRELAGRAWGDGAMLYRGAISDMGLVSLTSALLFCDELERAIDVCDLTQAAIGDRKLPLAEATIRRCRAWPLYEQGRIAEATAEANGALDAPHVATDVRSVAGVLACCLIQTGQLAPAERSLAVIDDEAVSRTIQHPFLLDVRAQLRLAQHRPLDALRDATEAGRALQSEHSVVNPGAVAWRSTAALAHLALGQPQRAEELAAEELELAKRIGITRVVIRDLRILGLTTGGPAGIELLEEAARCSESYPGRLESIHAQVELGAALRRAKKRAAARQPLREALAHSHRNGATALAERAFTELAASGARPRRLHLTGVSALTPSERRVAELAARGLTTRAIAEALFVTPKTVEFHLRHTYRKLDIASRGQLAEALSDQQAA